MVPEVDHEERVRRRMEIESEQRGTRPRDVDGPAQLAFLAEDENLSNAAVGTAEVEVGDVDVARLRIDGNAFGIALRWWQAREGGRLATIPGIRGR